MARYITKITFPASHGADGWEWTNYFPDPWAYRPYVDVPGTYRVTLWKCELTAGVQIPTTEMGHIDFTLSTPADYSWATKVLSCGTDLPLDDDAATYALVFSARTPLSNLLNIGSHEGFYEWPANIPEGWGYEFANTGGVWRNDWLQPFQIAIEQDDLLLNDFLESGEPVGMYSVWDWDFPLSDPPGAPYDEQHLIYFPIDAVYVPPPLPVQASVPTPANTATGIVKADLLLQWATGEDETGQNVYFGPTGSMVLVSTNQSGHTFAVTSSALTHNTQFSWRVDTINGAGTTTGAVWTFTVAAFSPPADLVVHKFLVAAANSKLFYET